MDDEMQMIVAMTHTAIETRDFANNLVKTLVTHFKNEGHINSAEEGHAIKIKDFTNEGRIKFLNKLSQEAKYSVISFMDTKHVNFRQDESKSNPPQDILWMRDKIDDLNMKGKDLHVTFFVNDDNYYKYIQLLGITCE